MQRMRTREDLLLGLCAEAEAAWPEFRVQRPAFLEKLNELVPTADLPARADERFHHVDLYLASACAAGDATALTVFTRRYLSRIDHYLRRFANSAVSFDEVRTTLEDKLLFSSVKDGVPRIRQYNGRGPLEAWVAMAAQRAVLSILRARGTASRTDSTSGLCDLWSEAYELERAHSHRYADAIKEIVREAIRSLPVRQRNILRLSIIEDVSLSQIARMLNVHQSTVSRAFHASLNKVNEEVRARLKAVHGIGDSEVESIVRQLQSRIDLSLSGVFADMPELVPGLLEPIALPVE
jgi:RNA polymerase sigma-70 factor (ECF subfamily)